jgi:hypothetical protein
MFFLLLLVGATPVFIWAVMTQRIELRKRAATSEAVVCWNRVLPSTEGNHAWPNGCKGNPNPQMCSQATVPLTPSETYKYNEWVANGKPYIPGCGMTPPNTTSINWKTQYAYLSATDLVITANGKTFKGNGQVTVHSNPASATYTTLESTWQENGVEMRMYIYFDASACSKSLPPQCNWKIQELRIYNGNSQGDWIYFKGGDTISVGARVGEAYTSPSLTLTSSENGIGKIVFTNLKLQAFLSGPTTPTPPPPSGCYYEQVKCFREPCNAVLICPTPGPNSCTGARNGATCTIGSCPTCAPGRACPAIACKLQSGTCQNGQCVPPTRELTCNNLQTSQSSYFTQCAKEGYSGVCFNKYSGVYQGCTKPGNNDCTQNNTNAAVNVLCPAVIAPTPTCIPRPACMDPLPGQPQCIPDLAPGAWLCPKTTTPTPTCVPRPRCLTGNEFPDCKFAGAPAPLPAGAYYCPQTPSPTAMCKTGVNSFSVQSPCKNDSTFVSATYTCYDGTRGTVGGDIRMCQTSLALAELAQKACAGHSSCRPTPTVTGAKKPGDFNGDGKVDIFDYNVVLANFGKTGPVGFSPADLNADGKVDLFDYNMMLNYFGK